MFSDQKIIISVKNRGVRKQRVSEKHVFVQLKIIHSMKNRGCPKTKGVQKHRIITVLQGSEAMIKLHDTDTTVHVTKGNSGV